MARSSEAKRVVSGFIVGLVSVLGNWLLKGTGEDKMGAKRSEEIRIARTGESNSAGVDFGGAIP